MSNEKFDLFRIQMVIGYNFKNPKLLQQAFTRRSFSQENPGFADNEVLEFYGDSALNFYITCELCKEFGKIEESQFVSEKNESELTRLRTRYVNKQKLSEGIKKLGLEKFLFLGTSDIKNEAWKSDSVKEDLFEAIVGAVAVDCDWNMAYIKKVCKNLSSVSNFQENYIKLLEEECKKRGLEKPYIYERYMWFKLRSSINPSPLFYRSKSHDDVDFGGARFSVSLRNFSTSFTEFGSTNADSIMLGAKKAYEWLLRQDKIKKEIEKIDENLAANQLNDLFRKKLIENPVYSFKELHDENGKAFWNCCCKLQECEDSFEAKNPSKKKAKQEAAALALHFLWGE